MPFTLTLTALALAVLRRVSAQSQMIQIPTDFNDTSYAELMNCVNAIGISYDVTIDNGCVVFVPVQDASIELNGTDSSLGTCMDLNAEYTNLAVDESRDLIQNLTVVSLANATAQWAFSNGAQGLSLQNSSSISARSLGHAHGGSLIERQTDGFIAYPDNEDKHCTNGGFQIDHTDICLSNSKKFKSVEFGNIANHYNLRMGIWPHHHCGVNYPVGQRGGRFFTVPPQATSICHSRPTYSWIGTYH